MSQRQDIDEIIRRWPYQPGVVSARLVKADDGREVLQMRIEMGLLQMETVGRPDGERPGGVETCLDELIQQAFAEGDSFVLTEDRCFEVDREFLQFYHRRICYLALRDFERAIADADHTLALMDFAAAHSPDPEWTLSHEQYRPFVLFHRAQAAAMAALQEAGPEAAIEQIDRGLQRIRAIFVTMEAEEQFDQDQLVAQLAELRESLRDEYHVGRTLAEQLADAVANEEYERAARLRDEIAQRRKRG
ncbi:MAG: UvrB/UvrC motif-containing protein [Pirellulales bacterium]|nr:UvrB/UvrC motif-containing protein [Pirellulales bacterium]